MNNYNNKDYTDIGILDIIIDEIDISELDYQAVGYNYKVLINYCNKQKNKSGYRLIYFESQKQMVDFIENEINDLEWYTINGF